MRRVVYGSGPKSSGTKEHVDSTAPLEALKPARPESLLACEGGSMNELTASISSIKSDVDFNKWLTSFIDEVRRNPDVFSQNPELLDLLRNLSRFSASDHRGYFSSLGGQSPAQNPLSWQLLAHALYSNFPGNV